MDRNAAPTEITSFWASLPAENDAREMHRSLLQRRLAALTGTSNTARQRREFELGH